MNLKPGDIVQIKPDFKTKCFGGCLLVVTDLKSFGVMGYIQGVGETFEKSAGQFYLRLNFEDFEVTGGVSPWIVGGGDNE